MRPDSHTFDFLFGCSQDEISEKVILTPFIAVEKFAGDSVIKKAFKGRLYSGINVGSEKNSYTVIKCPMGSGLAGDCVMFLGGAKVRSIIYAGSCGGLRNSDLGDILLCEKAFSGGSFSDYYPPGKSFAEILFSGGIFQASERLLDDIERLVISSTEELHFAKKGSVFTIASLFAETPENVKLIEKQGFDGIDMELAAVYHASVFSGIEAAGILFVSDRPLKKSFWNDFLPEEKMKIKDAIEKIVKISMIFCGESF